MYLGFNPLVLLLKVDKDLDEMKDAVLDLFKEVHHSGQTFKITTRRADKTYFLDTNELNHAFGAHILQNVSDLKVDVKNPDINYAN